LLQNLKQSLRQSELAFKVGLDASS